MLDYIPRWRWAARRWQKSTTKAGMSFRISNLRFPCVAPSRRLPEVAPILEAGKSSCGQVSWEGAFLNRRFRAEITGTFGKGRPREERPDDQTAATGGAGRKVWGLRTKPECPLVSEALCSRLYSRSR